MPSKDTRHCLRCKRDLPKSAFDRYFNPRERRFQGWMTSCRECKAVAAAKYPPLPPPNPSGLCMCGCGRLTPISPATDRRFGLVKGQPVRYLHGHWQERQEIRIDPSRFTVDPETDCWIWNDATNANGYAIMGNRDGGSCLVHRIYYEIVHGPIPDGLPLDHVKKRGCRYKNCVNPWHTEPVTPLENTRRGAVMKLTENDVAQIRALDGTIPNREIARIFGVTETNIRFILQRRTWK